MSFRELFVKVLLLSALVTGGVAHAAVVLFDDISSTFSPAGIAINGPSSSYNGAGSGGFGYRFTPSATSLLGQIDVGAIFHMDGTNSVQFTLYSDNSGLPGTALDTWTVTGLPAFNTACCTLETLVPHGPITLNSSSQYWLTVYPSAADTYAAWYYNTLGITGLYAYTTDGVTFNSNGNTLPTGVFDVIGTTAPEPGTFVLIASGFCLGFARCYRAGRRAVSRRVPVCADACRS